MQEVALDRRTASRRTARGGGRRVTDPAIGAQPVPDCPACLESGVAVPAGEADGGWWFVCLACDHLWDERQAAPGRRTHPQSR